MLWWGIGWASFIPRGKAKLLDLLLIFTWAEDGSRDRSHTEEQETACTHPKPRSAARWALVFVMGQREAKHPSWEAAEQPHGNTYMSLLFLKKKTNYYLKSIVSQARQHHISSLELILNCVSFSVFTAYQPHCLLAGEHTTSSGKPLRDAN